MRTHFKPTETSKFTHFTFCHPLGVRKGFIKGQAPGLLITNTSLKTKFEENNAQFKQRIRQMPSSEVSQVETFSNGAAKQVSAGVVLFNMVGFMKLFELPLRDRFHEVVLHGENLVFITTAIVATVAEVRT